MCNILQIVVALAMAAASLPSVSRSDLIIVEDFSGSLESGPFAEVRSNLTAALPALVETLNVQRVEVRSFDTDGWLSQRLAEQELPEFHAPVEEPEEQNEALTFGNVKDADANERRRRDDAALAEAKRMYRSQLARKLKGIVPLASPNPNYESASSDIVGAFRFVTELNATHPVYVIMITDLADTKFKEFPHLRAPRANVKLLLMFVPAKASEILRLTGQSLAGWQQYDRRAKELHEAAPWAIIRPHTEHHFADLLVNGVGTQP